MSKTPEKENTSENDHHEVDTITHVSGMFKTWFIDYASYVILERAVPMINDGFKPVQRRILHSMWEMEDGRYNKVANIIGNTMKYHPHGDASIGDALVQVGQKDLLIDCQGNWGNILTGDNAAAPRYIEARLSKLALEIAFNPKTTVWQPSYDGRNKEPKSLPVKFPILLAHGVEGIAVGLACKILPHNFIELVEASIQILKGKKAMVYPDFPTGGIADCTEYRDGLRGGKIKIRTRIKELNAKTLVITEIPFGTTTSSLIDTIITANDKGKIKIRKVEDNTSENVEILIHLQAGISPDKTIDALYAFTDCEISISPNACTIENDKPRFAGISEILKTSTAQTTQLLKLELEIEKSELEEKWHFSSLEKIFIKEEMYIDFKKYSDKSTLFTYLFERFAPHRKKMMRPISQEDLDRLTQIPMIRITRFDTIKAEDWMKELDVKIAQAKNNLANLTEYAIEYFKTLRKKFGDGKERRTEIKHLETIDSRQATLANHKLYINREEGFIGTGLKKDELLFECSDLDDIIAFTRGGRMKVCKVEEKVFIGKDILHAAIFKKNDEKTTYNLIYRDGPKGISFIKRFNVTGITRDKEYDLTKGSPESEVLWLTVNPHGESEKVLVHLRKATGLRKFEIEMDFSIVQVKGRNAVGNIVTKYTVNKVALKSKGTANVQADDLWFDDAIHRLNSEGRGTHLGKFTGDDKLITITSAGYQKIHSRELHNHFEEDIILIEKFDPKKIFTLVYFDGESKSFFGKRFQAGDASLNSKTLLITEHEKSVVEWVTPHPDPIAELSFAKEKDKQPKPELLSLNAFLAVMHSRAKGKRLSPLKVKDVVLKDSPEKSSKKTGELTEMELHRRAMEKISRKAAQDFMNGDKGGQTKLKFD